MPIYQRGEVNIYYEEVGSGFPILLIAPGGMKSAISFWQSTPWNPMEVLADQFRVIAMDQRNAGRSTAPVTAADGWHSYTQDQLGLMDHLGIDQFHVAGMCIGGPYALALIETAPQRVVSATLFQSIGRDNNQAAFYAMFDDWAQPLKSEVPTAQEADWSAFRERMYGGERVLFCLDEQFVANCSTPLLVLQGDDLYHPKSTSKMLEATAPNVQYVESWKEGSARQEAMTICRDFLVQHTPS